MTFNEFAELLGLEDDENRIIFSTRSKNFFMDNKIVNAFNDFIEQCPCRLFLKLKGSGIYLWGHQAKEIVRGSKVEFVQIVPDANGKFLVVFSDEN